ncbi:fumarylacetoacetate hydrolase family protein [Chitinasiproducens palmae]|uniref:2-keto-4-pentenoate hydratase/2-oxohepta-3-ene-1,7-dioic acid hydratase (Catechol pathway) n=1 Tax=Chitinasiproducens palmae TaxID=1770053 RepID=A0A1H2PUA9_9BURK|nr:fumarylacetoacetate hydrolase family protein [Chitinasiproducens palmae]SDV50765.1 2-keto-4-pentenoate hydratase/2-oxohepta-3-ene-1,7-dioic acid hydratase (catechol pathway) [Chitinasiproducens palmae]
MKLLSFDLDGRRAWGVLADERHDRFDLVDGRGLSMGRFPTVEAVLQAGALDEMAKLAARARPSLDSRQIALALPVLPGKLLAVGGNFHAHAREIGLSEPDGPTAPIFFSRFVDSLALPGAPLIRPRVSTQLDFEGELAVIIGKPAHCIDAADAPACVAAYTCFNDGSVRDYQKASITAGKNFWRSGSLGPWLVTPDALPDPSRCMLETRLNGEIMQTAPLSDLIYSVAELVAYASTFTPLACGDVIATGTPAGIGARRVPPRWLSPGDVVEVEISGIGVLRNGIADA